MTDAQVLTQLKPLVGAPVLIGWGKELEITCLYEKDGIHVLIRSRSEKPLHWQDALVYADYLTCFQIPHNIFNPEVILLLSRDCVVFHVHTKHGSCQRTVQFVEKPKGREPGCCLWERGQQAYDQHSKSIQTVCPSISSMFLAQTAFKERSLLSAAHTHKQM